MLPNAEMKNRSPATISDFLRPRFVARKPEIAEPIIHPIKAEAEVKPCHPSVYAKSFASMKKA